jgi:branched-subunit amino acid transport protein
MFYTARVYPDITEIVRNTLFKIVLKNTMQFFGSFTCFTIWRSQLFREGGFTMNQWKIFSIVAGLVCFLTAVRGHYIIAGVLFVVAVLCAQRGVAANHHGSDRHDH